MRPFCTHKWYLLEAHLKRGILNKHTQLFFVCLHCAKQRRTTLTTELSRESFNELKEIYNANRDTIPDVRWKLV